MRIEPLELAGSYSVDTLRPDTRLSPRRLQLLSVVEYSKCVVSDISKRRPDDLGTHPVTTMRQFFVAFGGWIPQWKPIRFASSYYWC